MSRTAFDRWDLDLGDLGGVGVRPPCIVEYGADHWNELPLLDGSLWAACFDLRWQFIAYAEPLMMRNNYRCWDRWIPLNATNAEWVREHGRKNMAATSRSKHLELARGFAQVLVENNGDLGVIERTFDGTPLGDYFPTGDVWGPVVRAFAAGESNTSADVRAWYLMWGLYRYGRFDWEPRTVVALVDGCVELLQRYAEVRVGSRVGDSILQELRRPAMRLALETMGWDYSVR